MRKSLFIICLLLTFTAGKAQNIIPIAEARSKGPDSVVTVTGIVTSGSEFNPARYFQDASAGISIYWSNSAVTSLVPGDSIIVSGKLMHFNNLLQFASSPAPTVTLVASGKKVPAPLEFNNPMDAFQEQYEGMLVKVNGINSIKTVITGNNCGTAPSTFSGNTNYCLNSSSLTAIRVNTSATDIVGKAVPGGNISITGIMSQFKSGGYDPFSGTGFQLLPRTYGDFHLAPTPNINSRIRPIGITQNLITLHFTTINDGNTIIEWGTTAALGNIDSLSALTKNHIINISGLTAATVYYIKASSRNSAGISTSTVQPVASMSNSTGDIKVYFNRAVDTTLALNGNKAKHLNEAIDDTLIQYINRAVSTVDVTIYNWTSDFSNIANAMNQAAQRGVRVRVIYDAGSSNTAVPFLGSQVNKAGKPSNTPNIMHNKFVVIDADHADHSLPLVWTGSTNWTDGQINDDPNSVIIIQDKSLAIAYRMEFEEMWGSNTATPGTLNFGATKTDNTPQHFIIGGRGVECYFSPSDNANAEILETIKAANHDLQIATMLMTRNDIATAIVNQLNRSGFDKNCSALLLNDTAIPAPYYIVQNVLGPRAVVDAGGEIMHHKYLMVDALDTTSDPMILVGSHNWSNAANNGNDENTLIVHDKLVVNQYYQEFAQRLKDFNISGLQACNNFGSYSSVKETKKDELLVYPNPGTGSFNIQFEAEGSKELIVCNLAGQVVYRAESNEKLISFDLSAESNGLYFITVKTKGSISSSKLVLMR